jgi:periplasmic protein TonB
MTAAALKPDLFNHLFATEPQRPDKGTLAATLFSVALHGSIVAILLWAGQQIREDSAPAQTEVFPPIILPRFEAPSSGERAAAPIPGGGMVAATPIPLPGPIAPGIPDLSMAENDFGVPGTPDQRMAGTPGAPGDVGRAGDDGAFTAVEVMPALVNAAEVKRALERSYPPLLRDSGIGGRTLLLLLIDEAGKVIEAKVHESSGHSALDRAALAVSPLMRFSPAMNRDQRVKVWAQVPLDFRTN